MPDRIHLLPDSVANQIAAGEVIQRPASVIKELVENAVDAGADDIRIFIKDAGRTLIQVIDNGSGMSETDTRMAFERHATSKISSSADLSSLTTMGFRGEALPSICAISQVEVKSRTRNAPIGTHLIISGSKVESQLPDMCDTGTNIMVKNIFFNVPARRKFLKSDSVELSNIMREFERLALVNPGIKMSIDTGSRTIELQKSTMLKRISDIWKGNLSQQLIPVEADTPTVKISGYISRPEYARRRNALQYFLVNGRNMRHPYFKKAIHNCFKGLIAPDSMPCFFIKFDIDPAAIDVNIHPTKDEIKFEEETVIWSVLTAAVKASLGKNSAVPSIDFDSEALPVVHISPKEEESLPAYDIPQDYNPFASAASGSKSRHSRNDDGNSKTHGVTPSNWDMLYDKFMNNSPLPSIREQKPSAPRLPEMDSEEEITADHTLQFDSKYVVAAIEKKGVIIVDQYRAHVKILFEQLKENSESNHHVSQSLLFPSLLELGPEQEATLLDTLDTLHSLGMVIEKEGTDYIITGVTPGISADSAAEIVLRIIESIADQSAQYGTETSEEVSASLRNRVILQMAKSMAVKRGRVLSEEERGELIKNLFSLPDPSLTPEGRRIYTLLDNAAIERLLP